MPLTKCSSASWSTSGLAVLPGGRSFGGHGSLLALASVAGGARGVALGRGTLALGRCALVRAVSRSEEHTSELQSRLHLVCRLLLEKKKKNQSNITRYKKKKKKA